MREHDELCRALLADAPEAIACGILDLDSKRVLGRAVRGDGPARFAPLAAFSLDLYRGSSIQGMSDDLRLQVGMPGSVQPGSRRLAVRVGALHLLVRTDRAGRVVLFLALERGQPSEKIWAQMEITTHLVSTLGVSRSGRGAFAPPSTDSEASVPTTLDP